MKFFVQESLTSIPPAEGKKIICFNYEKLLTYGQPNFLDLQRVHSELKSEQMDKIHMISGVQHKILIRQIHERCFQ